MFSQSEEIRKEKLKIFTKNVKKIQYFRKDECQSGV